MIDGIEIQKQGVGMRIAKKAAILGVALFVAAAVVHAQTSTGGVTGTVTDKTGAAVSGAAVKLTNQGTRIIKEGQTNSNGYFTFINVQPGSYILTVEKPGFKSASVTTFEIQVNQTLTQNVQLEVGAVSEKVIVSTEAPLLQSSTSELGTVIEERPLKELPLNGRNFTQLLILTPGITPISSAQGSGISATDAGITAIPGTSFYKPSVNGQENRENLFYLDGILNTDIRGAVYGVLPILDTLNEFKVQSQNDKPEFGGTLGGIVNVATKAGTNNFHGSAWDFARSDIFDARNPFNDICSPPQCSTATAIPPGHYSQNEFGGAMGGPIFKNKTFFYAGYEGWRFSQPSNNFATVPTQSELGLAPGLNGNLDFTGSLQGTISATAQTANQLYNPYSPGGATPFQCVPGTGSGNAFSASGYTPMTPEPINTTPGTGFGTQPTGVACDIIPSGLVNQQMVQLVQAYFQQPNFAPAYGEENNNFFDTRQHTDNMNSWQIRLDQNFRARDTVFLRLSQMWVNDTQPIQGTISQNPQTYHAYNLGGAWDHVFSPHLILDARAGAMLKPYTFYQNAGLPPVGFKPETAAGFTGIDATQGFFMTGIDSRTIGSQAANLRGNPVANADGSLTWIKGNHNMKMGAQYIYTNRYQQNNFTEVDYSANQTSSGLKSQPNQGNSLASALLALPTSFSVQTPTYSLVYLKMPAWAGYFQDEWHIKPTLTLSGGLRYDYIPQANIIGPSGRPLNAIDLFHQQWLVGMDGSAINACTTPFVNPCVPGGFTSSNTNFNVTVPLSGQTYNTFGNIVFKGTAASAQSITDNWGPRVGIAWQFLRNTVLRGGYGIFYDTITARSQWVQNTLLGADWPWTEGSSSLPFNQGNAAGGSTALSPMSTLIAQGLTPSVANTPWALNQNGGFANDPSYIDARSQQWHMDLERQLGNNMKVSVAYVGSKSDRLDWTGNANAAPFASPLLNSPVQTSAQGVSSCGAKGSATDTATCEKAYYTAVDSLRVMPWGRSDYHYSTSTGYANYHALQAEFQRRFSNGLLALASYTWSKCLGVSSGWFNVENGTNGGTVTENYFNQNLSYGPCAFDIPQDVTLSADYELPSGHGKKYLTHGPLSWVLGNWETNLFFIGRSGQNFEVTNGSGDPAALSGSGGIGKTSVSGYDRPDVVPGQSLITSNQSQAQWFNPAALCIIPSSPGQTAPKALSPMCTTALHGGFPVFGDFGVGVLRDQFFYNVDFSMSKRFRISEGKSLQIRAEAFNVFNMQILGTPGGDVTQGNLGVIHSIASTPRQLQFGAKFAF
jgi:carboxypeptidase family protein/TonB-dependent receptor-like protein